MGLTIKNFKDIISAGADCITMGNHTWGKKENAKTIENKSKSKKSRENLLKIKKISKKY